VEIWIDLLARFSPLLLLLLVLAGVCAGFCECV
jgi:F0F1-type ATP synthase assembly protein I